MINYPMRIYMGPSVWINEAISVLDDINEKNSTRLRPLEAICSAREDIDTNSDNPKGYLDITPINSTKSTTCNSQNQDVNIVHNYYAPFLYTTKLEDVFPGT